MTADDLIAFESRVIEAFEAKRIPGPVHLSGGNEAQLIEIFKDIGPHDYVFSTWRSHYHALLKGVPHETVMAEILAGRSMNLCFPEHRFYTSAIVGGCLPIAVGVAAGLKRAGSDAKVWCFIGDMAASTGAHHEAHQYAVGHGLPVIFVEESNGMSCDTRTWLTWGLKDETDATMIYDYERTHPHVGTGKYVTF